MGCLVSNFMGACLKHPLTRSMPKTQIGFSFCNRLEKHWITFHWSTHEKHLLRKIFLLNGFDNCGSSPSKFVNIEPSQTTCLSRLPLSHNIQATAFFSQYKEENHAKVLFMSSTCIKDFLTAIPARLSNLNFLVVLKKKLEVPTK